MTALLECGFPGNQNSSFKVHQHSRAFGKTLYKLYKSFSFLYASFISTLLPHAHASICNSSTRLPGECPMASKEDVGTLPSLASPLRPQVLHAGLWGELRSGGIVGGYQFDFLSKLHWAFCNDVSSQHASHTDVNCFDCTGGAEIKQLRDTIKKWNIYRSIYWL